MSDSSNVPPDSFIRAEWTWLRGRGATAGERMGVNFKPGRLASGGVQLTAGNSLS